MAQMQYHNPAMTEQVVSLLAPLGRGLIVDATLGGGGHTRAILAAMPEATVIGLDRDQDAAAQAPDDPRFRFVKASFADLDLVLAEATGTEGPQLERPVEPGVGADVAGVLFDLGVSSHQLDAGGRGFSYRRPGPLDMRMGDDAPIDASTVVNEWDQRELASIIRRYGEERFANRIAEAIVAARPLADTLELAQAVAGAVPQAARRRGHPARKTFQAIRIAVNDELHALELGLDAALRWTRPGGRVVVISYHSLEDRIVKRRFAAGTSGCECPPDLPVCVCGRVAELRSLARKPLRPGEDETAKNPRVRSARLRAVEKVA